jgi:hypothetical protein
LPAPILLWRQPAGRRGAWGFHNVFVKNVKLKIRQSLKTFVKRLNRAHFASIRATEGQNVASIQSFWRFFCQYDQRSGRRTSF